MSGRKDFTIDENGFELLPKFVETLHSLNMRYVPMFDPFIALKHNYRPFDLGMQLNVFVKNTSGQLFVGQVWPGESVWPDFFHPNATTYWTTLFKTYHDTLPFDGAWLDMNDPANFIDGAKEGCPLNSLESPQYTIGSTGDPLRHKTLCMSAKHYSGLHYDLHNIYALSETKTTYE